ncbi:MAG: hypothetical protein OEZ34_08295 [Spirochaetia bacterium]|nr:hypothetical protein [Spirochaetia bacterium]
MNLFNFPPSFLGSRASSLVDLIILSLAVIVPVMFYSYLSAKKRKYSVHKSFQVGLTAVLTVTILLFEIDMSKHGGIFEMSRGGMFENTLLLNLSIYVHLFFSVSTSIIWLVLIVISLIRFPSPPVPSAFSKTHRFWGKAGMIFMLMTAVTGVELFFVGLYL